MFVRLVSYFYGAVDYDRMLSALWSLVDVSSVFDYVLYESIVSLLGLTHKPLEWLSSLLIRCTDCAVAGFSGSRLSPCYSWCDPRNGFWSVALHSIAFDWTIICWKYASMCPLPCDWCGGLTRADEWRYIFMPSLVGLLLNTSETQSIRLSNP